MSKAQDKDNEALILQAAEREFLLKGFAGARTTSIAEAAGVTHAMFHYYFRTKEKLFERIISEKIAQLKESLQGSIADLDAPLDVILRNVINSHLDFIAANPDLPRFLLGEIYSNSERSLIFLNNLKKFVPSVIGIIQTKIDEAAAAGRCRRVDAGMLMLDVVSLNVFPYMAAPVINAALGNCMTDTKAFLEERKKENYETIMRKLRP